MKKIISIVLVFMLIVSVGISYHSITLANNRKKSEWPMFRRNTEHTGEVGAKFAPKTNRVTKLWSFKAGGTIYSSPSIVNDKVFFGSLDKNMYCLDADTGDERWSYRAKEPIKSAPSIMSGNAYFGSLDGRFHCVDDEGENVWTFDTKRRGGIADSSIVSGGSVIFGTLDGYLMCITKDGEEELWKVKYDDAFTSSPALSNGSIVIGTRDFELMCYDEFSGDKLWQQKLDGSVYSSASILDNYVYVGCDRNKIYCLDLENGDIIWDVDTVQGVRSAPALSSKYVIFSSGKFIYCLWQETGETVWKYAHQGQGFSSMAISGEKVYASMGSQLLCLDVDTGYKIWEEDLESEGFSPSIAYNKIYIGTKAGYMHCFTDDTLPSDVKINPAILNLGALPPRAAASGEISISLPLEVDVEKQTELEIGIETDAEWFSAVAESDIVTSNESLKVSITVDDGILSEDKTWYSDVVKFKIGDIEYPVFVKIYTDSDLDFGDSGEIIIDKSGCSWTSENCNPAGDSNATEFCGPDGDVLSKVWEEDFGDTLKNSTIVAHGFVYVTPSYSRDVFCYDVKTGELVWSAELEGYNNNSPALFGGSLFIPTNLGIEAISIKNGEVLWSQDDNTDISTPVAASNGKIFYGTTSGEVFCLNSQTSDLLWAFEAFEPICTSIAISPGHVYFGSADKKLHCVELGTGDEIWTFETKDPLIASPVYIDDKVIVAAKNKRLFLLDAESGEQIWFANTVGEARITPACNEEFIFLITKDSYIRCFNMETGKVKWKSEIDEDIEAHPTLSGKRLYFGSWDKNLYCIDTVTGIKLWEYEATSKIRSPIVVAGGNVFLSAGRNLTCFSDPPPDIIISPSLVDFGGISDEGGGRLIEELTLENTTDETIIVEFSVDPDVKWVTPVTEELTIEPGEKEIALVSINDKKIPAGMPSDYLNVSWNETVVPVIIRAYRVDKGTMKYSNWFAFGFDQLRTGSTSPTEGPQTKKLQKRWEFNTYLETDASPIINDDKIFIGFGNIFYCLDANTGDFEWSKEFDREGFSTAGSCTGVAGESVYFGAADTYMYCLDNETGNTNWKFKTGGPIFSSPCVFEKSLRANDPTQRRVYFGSLDKKVYCILAKTGDFVWEFETGGSVYSSPCITPQGEMIFVGSVDDNMYGIDTQTGKAIWSFQTGGSVYSTPCAFVHRSTADNEAIYDINLYFGSNDGNMYCLNGLTGEMIWKYETGSPIVCSSALHDGKIYFGNLKGDFYVLSRTTGDKIKMIKLGSQVRSSPSLSARNCYISTKNGRFFKLDSDTLEIAWNTNIGAGSGHFQSSPAIWSQNVYVADRDGILHCFYEKPAEVEFSRTTIDFGRVPKGSLKTEKLLIKNNSEDDIELKFDKEDSWFEMDKAAVTVEPGEEITLTIMTKPGELENSGPKYGGIWIKWYSLEDERNEYKRITVALTVN